MKKKVTFSDIAAYANCSKMSVSRYFNNPDMLAEETKKEIEKAINELDYKTNKVAKILANGKSEFIGIIIPELFFDYYSKILNEILTSYNKYNYKFIVFAGNHDKKLEKKYIEELLAYQVEGLIILSYTLSSKQLKEFNIPIVTIEREDKFVSSINTNNYLGAELATNELINNKCDMLIHINGFVKKDVPSYKRITGFKDMCEKNHKPYEIIQREFVNDYDETYKTLKDIYVYLQDKYKDQKIGVFISNDNHAYTFLNILLKNKQKVPEHYEIIAFDDSISKEAVIPISSISQDTRKIADTAVNLLKKQISQKSKNGEIDIEHILIDPQLIKRDSTSD